jgi:hypothetical protein
MSLIPTTQVNVSPDDYKRKMAYALMMQGASADPIQHWTQGLARLGQGAMGGYELYRDEQKQKQDESDATAAYLKYLQPQGGAPQAPAAAPQPPQSTPSPVASALGSSPRQPVAPTPKVWGDQEAEAAGLYEKPTQVASLGPVPMPMQRPPAAGPAAAALSAPAAAPPAAPAPTEPQMSDAKAKIAQLLQSQSRADRMLGKSLAEAEIVQSIKPETTDELKEYNFAKKQGYKGSFVDFKTELKKAGKPETNVNVGGGSDKQIFDAMDESAKEARQTAAGLTGLREARNAIQGGAITGAGANQILGLQKIGAALGLADPSKIVNTETFRAAIAPQVAAVLKSTVGTTNISNTDREFAEKAAGGNITLDEKSITRLMDIMERASLGKLEAHQKKVEKIYSDPEKYGRERALFGVDMPAAPMAPPPAAPDINTLKKKYGLD